MPYLNYNLPIYRTGFRPYGQAKSWDATQLSGLGRHGTFTEPGGWRLGLGQWQSGFSPWVLRAGMHGLGQDPNCASGMPYDVNGNPCPSSIPSGADPNCAVGMPYDVNGNPCGPPGTASKGYNVPDVTPAGGNCISAISGQAIPCPGGTSAGSVSLPPGSAPRVPVSPGLFPQTSPQTLYTGTPGAPAAPYGTGFGTTQGCPTGYSLNAQGQCAPAALASLTNYMPWILGIAAVAAVIGLSRR